MTTLYVHGFASTGESSTAAKLREILPDETVLAPTLSHEPAADFEMLCDLVRTQGVTTVVGSSLGGFYAVALAQKFDLRVVLINPSLTPYDSLSLHLGRVTVYGTDRTFWWTQTQLLQLREIAEKYVEPALTATDSGLTWKNVYVLLGGKDAVIDPMVTAKRFQRAFVTVDPGAGHRFGDITQYGPMFRKAASSPSDYGECFDI